MQLLHPLHFRPPLGLVHASLILFSKLIVYNYCIPSTPTFEHSSASTATAALEPVTRRPWYVSNKIVRDHSPHCPFFRKSRRLPCGRESCSLTMSAAAVLINTRTTVPNARPLRMTRINGWYRFSLRLESPSNGAFSAWPRSTLSRPGVLDI